MFIQEKKNKSNFVSIQIVRKEKGAYKVIKSVGYATMRPEINAHKWQAQQYVDGSKQQASLLMSERDASALQTIAGLSIGERNKTSWGADADHVPNRDRAA